MVPVVPFFNSASRIRRLCARLVLSLTLLLGLSLGVAPALAISVNDFPATPPSSHLLDQGDVFSRASRGEVEKQLESLAAERVDARLVTINRLDYGLTLDQLGQQLLQRWGGSSADGADANQLLLLIDTKTKAATVLASPQLERQLPADLLRSTARSTMAQPLRDGDRYRQATVDALDRLATVLRGGDDPGETVIEEAPVVPTNIPTREETQSSNAFTWVVVLLVVGSVVPMLTWWVFSR
ncbi:MAG: TPM domain-containing protein [Cyanobium sp.]